MQLKRMFDELSGLILEYHELTPIQNDKIVLTTCSQRSEGVNEILKIKQIADKNDLNMRWDGHTIEISRK